MFQTRPPSNEDGVPAASGHVTRCSEGGCTDFASGPSRGVGSGLARAFVGTAGSS